MSTSTEILTDIHRLNHPNGRRQCPVCKGMKHVFTNRRCAGCNGKGFQTVNDVRRWVRIQGE